MAATDLPAVSVALVVVTLVVAVVVYRYWRARRAARHLRVTKETVDRLRAREELLP